MELNKGEFIDNLVLGNYTEIIKRILDDNVSIVHKSVTTSGMAKLIADEALTTSKCVRDRLDELEHRMESRERNIIVFANAENKLAEQNFDESYMLVSMQEFKAMKDTINSLTDRIAKLESNLSK